jgi:mannonate dehydratase
MRLALGAVREVTDEMLRYAVQLGYTEIVVNTPQNLPGHERWEVVDLRAMKSHVESYDLQVAAVENTPMSFYSDIMVGGVQAPNQIENYKHTIKSLGDAGIPILGFHWMANDVWRTSLAKAGRGGARLTEFDYELVPDPDEPTHGRVFPSSEMQIYFRRFMDEVLPVAEASGVRLALHPDDPPLESLGGIARLFWNHECLRNVVDEFGSSAAFGLEFCLGTVSEMGPGADDLLVEMVERDAVAYVHFRDVHGYVPKFQEAFLGQGNLDVVRLLQRLMEADFQGFLIDDHVPLLDGDPEIDDDWVKSPYAFRGRAYANGFLQGMVKALAEVRS